MKIMDTKFWHILAFLQKLVMVIASFTILFLVLFQVYLRYILVRPIMGVEEIATMVGFWLYFMGASWGTAERTHIKADVMSAILKDPKKLIWVKVLTSLMSVVLAIVMVSWGWNYVVWGYTRRQLSHTLMIPMVYSQASLFVGAILMVFYFIVELVDNFLQAIGRKPLDTPTLDEELPLVIDKAPEEIVLGNTGAPPASEN